MGKKLIIAVWIAAAAAASLRDGRTRPRGLRPEPATRAEAHPPTGRQGLFCPPAGGDGVGRPRRRRLRRFERSHRRRRPGNRRPRAAPAAVDPRRMERRERFAGGEGPAARLCGAERGDPPHADDAARRLAPPRRRRRPVPPGPLRAVRRIVEAGGPGAAEERQAGRGARRAVGRRDSQIAGQLPPSRRRLAVDLSPHGKGARRGRRRVDEAGGRGGGPVEEHVRPDVSGDRRGDAAISGRLAEEDRPQRGSDRRHPPIDSPRRRRRRLADRIGVLADRSEGVAGRGRVGRAAHGAASSREHDGPVFRPAFLRADVPLRPGRVASSPRKQGEGGATRRRGARAKPRQDGQRPGEPHDDGLCAAVAGAVRLGDARVRPRRRGLAPQSLSPERGTHLGRNAARSTRRPGGRGNPAENDRGGRRDSARGDADARRARRSPHLGRGPRRR